MKNVKSIKAICEPLMTKKKYYMTDIGKKYELTVR